MREDYIFADREVVDSYGLRAQSEREPPLGVAEPVQLHGPRRTLIRSICAVAVCTLMPEMRTCGGQPMRLEGLGGVLA